MSIKNTSCDLSIIKSITSQIHKTQNEIQVFQNTAASDIKKQHYYEMDPSLADQNLYVEDLLRQSELKVRNYEWSTNLLYMQESAIKNLNNTVEQAKILSVRALNQYGKVSIDMELDSKNLLVAIQDTLSNSFFGMNIWNGSNTNEVPFDDIVNGTAGANYYLGDNFGLKFHIDGLECEFGDKANYACFQNLIGALQKMRDIQDPTTEASKITIQEASAMLDEAQQGFVEFLQKAGNAQQRIKQATDEANTTLETVSELYVNSLNGMGETDRAISVINASAVQRKLSYMLPITMKYLNEMSIAKYL